MKRESAINTTKYSFTSTRLATMNKFDNGNSVDSRQNHPSPRTSPLARWRGSPNAPKAQSKSTLTPTFISPTSTVKQALEFQVFLNQETTSIPYAPDKTRPPLLIPYTKWARVKVGLKALSAQNKIT